MAQTAAAHRCQREGLTDDDRRVAYLESEIRELGCLLIAAFKLPTRTNTPGAVFVEPVDLMEPPS